MAIVGSATPNLAADLVADLPDDLDDRECNQREIRLLPPLRLDDDATLIRFHV